MVHKELTRENVLAEEAGDQLDFWVAEHVMGWHRGDSWGGAYWADEDRCSRYEVLQFKPSRYIDVAMYVLSKLEDDLYKYILTNDIVHFSPYCVFFRWEWDAKIKLDPGSQRGATGKTKQEAITKAALLLILHERSKR
jgi:hypothetical protein